MRLERWYGNIAQCRTNYVLSVEVTIQRQREVTVYMKKCVVVAMPETNDVATDTTSMTTRITVCGDKFYITKKSEY